MALNFRAYLIFAFFEIKDCSILATAYKQFNNIRNFAQTVLCILHSTYSLVGIIKGVITTFIGFFTFGGVPITLLNVGGITLNTIGGSMYTYTKYLEKKKSFSDRRMSKREPSTNESEVLEEGKARDRSSSSTKHNQMSEINGFVSVTLDTPRTE